MFLEYCANSSGHRSPAWQPFGGVFFQPLFGVAVRVSFATLAVALPFGVACLATVECREGDCRQGPGIIQYYEQDSYEGGFRDGIPHGRGVYRFWNGTTYEGEWDADRENGLGIVRRDDLNYVGHFEDGLFAGRGTEARNTGMRKHEFYAFWTTADIYEGQFVAGEREGRGRLYTGWPLRPELVYEGEWRRGKREGSGTSFLPHPKNQIRLYSGEWHDNRRHGQGTLYHPARAARKHVGEFRHGLRHGEGRLYLEIDGELQLFAGVWDKDFAVRLAGIRWQPERISRLSWRAARAYCERHAMRLPSLRELRVVYLAHAKGFQRDRTYWTSENTTDQLAYVLDFETGEEATSYTGDRNHLLCFR